MKADESILGSLKLLPLPSGSEGIHVYNDKDSWVVGCDDPKCRWMTFGWTVHGAVQPLHKPDIEHIESEGKV